MGEKLNLFIVLILTVLATSCNKEYDVDQQPIEPLLVQRLDSTFVHVDEILNLGNHYRAMQGMTVYGDFLYQFYSSSLCRVFSLHDGKFVSEIELPKGHYGSVAFSYDNHFDNDYPLLYVGGPMAEKTNPGFTIINMNTGEINVIEFDHEVATQVLCAFDFVHDIGYSFGYKDNDIDHELAPYEVTPFEISTGHCDLSKRFYIENEGHLQDACFDNGKIWICTGWNQLEWYRCPRQSRRS